MDAAVIGLPGGALLELLNYLVGDKSPHDLAAARPRNVYICPLSEDPEADFARAVALGSLPVSNRPVHVTAGPNTGARAAYLRVLDGIAVEFFRKPG
jgi:hypothetical protein